jgi:hypothetical protein
MSFISLSSPLPFGWKGAQQLLAWPQFIWKGFRTPFAWLRSYCKVFWTLRNEKLQEADENGQLEDVKPLVSNPDAHSLLAYYQHIN